MNATLRRHGTALLVFSVVIVLMAGPVLLRLQSEVIGTGGDPWQTLWRFTYTAQQLVDHQQAGGLGTYLAQELLGGGEPRLVNHTVWPYLPFHFWLGQPMTYNSVWLFSFIGSGYAMYLLVRYLLRAEAGEPWRHEAAALLAGLYYMLLPYHVAHAQGHFGAMQLQWLPLLTLTFFRLFDRFSAGRVVAFAAVATLQAWTEHHYTFWFSIFALAYLLYRFREGVLRLPSRNRGTACLLVGLLVIGVVLPYVPTVRLSTVASSALVLGEDQTSRFSADLFAFFTPSPFHPLWGSVANTLFTQHFTGNSSESTHFLGVVPLLLVLFLHQAVPLKQKRWWLLCTLLFLVISLGPWLHLLGYVAPVPLPYAVLDELPVFSAIRAVGRASSMVGLSMAVLIGFILLTQARRRASFVLIGALIMSEFWFAVPTTQSTTLNSIYNEVVTRPAPAIIELPAPTNYVSSSRALYASLFHGKDVIGSIALARGETGAAEQRLRTLPGLRQVLYLRSSQLQQNQPDFLDQSLTESFLEAAKLVKADTVIVHPDSISAIQLTALQTFFEEHLQLTPVRQSDAILYYLPEETVGDGVLIGREGGWANVGYDREKQVHVAAIPQEAGLLLINQSPQPVTVTLHAELPVTSHGNLILNVDQKSDYPATVDAQQLTLIFTVPPGEHHAQLRNQLTDTAILHNPRIEVTPTAF